MALQDYTAGAASQPMDGSRRHFLIRNLVDCYNSVANGGWGTLVSTDTARVLELKEGWFVKQVWVRLVKLGTLGNTVLTDVGDGGIEDTTWIATDMNIGANGTLNQVKGGVHATDVNPALNGYMYLADDYLVMTIGTASFNGKIEFVAEVVDVFGGSTIV